MSLIVMLITILFFISLTMLAASVFTPRTAIFFKVKTKARGALIWLLVIGACVLVLDFIAPEQSVFPAAKSVAAPESHSGRCLFALYA